LYIPCPTPSKALLFQFASRRPEEYTEEPRVSPR
jgi:hypothetical protein